jgi:hypothetical protein
VDPSVADPGCLSRIRLFSIPDPNCLHPGSRIRIKEFKYFNPPKKPKKWFLSSRKYDTGCSSRIRMLIFYPSRIQGPKRHRIPDPEPQHWWIHTDLQHSSFGLNIESSSLLAGLHFCSDEPVWFALCILFSYLSKRLILEQVLDYIAFPKS